MKLADRLLRVVKQRKSDVILRAEVAHMASQSQLSAALKSLQANFAERLPL